MLEHNPNLDQEQPKQLQTYESFAREFDFSLIPVNEETKIPVDKGWQRYCSEKREFNPKDFIRKLPDGEIVIRNAGVPTGPGNRIIVVDVDHFHKFKKWCKEQNIQNPLPETLTIKTSRGEHFYFRYPLDGKRYGKRKIPGIFDVLGIGAQAVAPGSIHPQTGKAYYVKDRKPIAEAPQWVLGILLGKDKPPKNNKPVAQTAKPLANASVGNDFFEGERNDQLTSLGGAMRNRGMTKEAIEAALLEENTHRCRPPLNQDEVLQIASSVSRYAPGKTTGFRLTDLGNAERLIAQFGEDIRFCAEEKKWFLWTGNHWIKDTHNRIINFAKKAIRSLYREASMLEDPDARNKLLSHAKRSESNFSIKAMLELAQSDPKIVISPGNFDAHPFLLNCSNGTVDLTTGPLFPHRKQDLLRHMIPVAFDAQAQCPQFENFVNSIMNHDENMVAYLQKIVGYILTGNIDEQCFFLLIGSGANGKTTLLNILKALLGSLAKSIDFNSLVYAGDRARSDLARLIGARLVISVEIDPRKTINETVVNRVTGGDPLTVKFLYSNEFEYFPKFTLCVAGNHQPNIEGASHGTWRRVRVVPFKVRFDEKTGMIKNLQEQLLTELPGILNWAIEGCLSWQREGLDPPEDVKQATEDFRKEKDTIREFMDKVCVIGPSAMIASVRLYELYAEWSMAEEYPFVGKKIFTKRLNDAGFEKKKDSKRENWIGIGERAQSEDVNDSDTAYQPPEAGADTAYQPPETVADAGAVEEAYEAPSEPVIFVYDDDENLL